MLWLPKENQIFPHPFSANPHGILAVGGELSTERLITAYWYGIFPWFNDQEPILWWFTSPRMVIFPKNIKISKSMGKLLARHPYTIHQNKAFEQVLEECSTINRAGQHGTWINSAMKKAYLELHQMGIARSIEVWEGNELVGGLYGIEMGKIFYGESMFSKKSNTSKLALIHLAQELQQRNFLLIDCQQDTPHMRSMGAELIDKNSFWKYLSLNRLEHLKDQSVMSKSIS